MSSSFIVLTEAVIGTPDAERALRFLGLEGNDEPPRVQIVVPQDLNKSLLAEVVDHLALLDVREALAEVIERFQHDSSPVEESTAVVKAAESAFKCVGAEVTTALCEKNPLPTLSRLLEDCETQTVVVFTQPQLVEEALQLDWSHQVEDHLQATVLHLYPGEERIGS